MSSSRRRLGVALVLDPPVSDEVDGLRRALGDPSLGRIPAHLTLVPPVNVRAGDLGSALGRLRAAAAHRREPLRLTFGPPSTFLPHNPVLYLAVGGDLGGLRGLRDTVFQPPLERKLSWPWVPHVTLADGIPEERITAAMAALGRYVAAVTLDRVVLLEEGSERTWRPLADCALERPVVIGAGGLPLEITRGRIVDPEVVRALSEEGDTLTRAYSAADFMAPLGTSFTPIVLTGRREGGVVAVSAAWVAADGGHIAVWVARAVRGQGLGTHLLHHLESGLHRAGWRYSALKAEGPQKFYSSRSDWSVAVVATGTEPRRTGPVS